MPRSTSSSLLSESPPQSPIYPTTPPPSLPPMMSHSKRPLTPAPLRGLSSPATPLTRSPSFPAPPTGHELMSLFPSAPPVLRDIDIVRYRSEKDLRLVNGQYVNTSTWFGREEREFFRSGVGKVSACKMDVDWDAEAARSFKRRRSVDGRYETTPSVQHYSPHPQVVPVPNTHTQHPLSHPDVKPVSQAPPSASTRRRAGKYTKRVFVHPSRATSPSPSSVSSPLASPTYDGRSPPSQAYAHQAPPSQGSLAPTNWSR